MANVSTNVCRSCCILCQTGRLQEDKTYKGAYSLNNFIAAGTLHLRLDSERPEVSCEHIHAEDGWHVFSGKLFDQHISADEPFCREMDFLIEHHFLCATYRFGPSLTVFMRIYLIPHDLSNVKGKLRVRKEAVMASARRYMKNLLPNICQNQDNWNGLCSQDASSLLFPRMKDLRTLAEIYGDLRSPTPNITPGWDHITSRLLDFQDDLDGLGLRTSLYNYQRRSVTSMIQKELDLRDIPDPLFIPLSSMNNQTFYLQPGVMEILQERPTVAATRSCILCEELGTGKTVMILALILATLNQISSPEESIVDDRPVLTPLSFRHFPSTEAISARKRFFNNRESVYPILGSGIPTLVELLLTRSRTHPDVAVLNPAYPHHRKRVEINSQIEDIRPGKLLCSNTPFYFSYNGKQVLGERAPRRLGYPGPRVVYLTSATLIIVPINLISQWDREIHKHCKYPVRVLILRSGTPAPRAQALASDYDIILMTYKRFTIESNSSRIEKLHSWDFCRCPEYAEARIPQCRCKAPDVSPLLQIRWKRLVIDEGHVSASLSTILTPFTKLLSVERRWIVTGTPTTNLLGLALGTRAMQLADQEPHASELEQDMSPDDDTLSQNDSASESDDVSTRVWNKYDREDLNKLGRMISHFISVPRFSSSPKIVSTHVVDPLLDPQGPRPGAIQVLNQVMEMTMIRHRIEDIEDDVVLPPIVHETIFLDLDPYALKSYNAMQATIAINAIDSQRTDEDYLFHPRNAEHLQTTVKNMSQIMFWSIDENLYNVDELLRTRYAYMRRAIERNISQEDITLLDEALTHVRLAAEDRVWRTMHSHEDVPYRVHGLLHSVLNAWTRTSVPQGREIPHFLHADRLLKMRDLVLQRPLVSEQALIERGLAVAVRDLELREQFLQSQKQRSNHRTGKHIDDSSSLLAEDAVRKAKNPNTLKEMQKDLNSALARLSDVEGEDLESTHPSPREQTCHYHGGSVLSSSLLGLVRLGCTASSKLNYIMNEVLNFSHAEKFLIFSESELTLAHISEALELINTKFLRFTTQINARVREQVVLTFETSETYRVLLMQLKHGARGLNLISASRVIFCEPVWQADVESQAIKRVHRIGQVKPITVKTLAIRGTVEETIIGRKEALKGSQTKLPKLIEESGMRHFIAKNPKFLKRSMEDGPDVDVPLLQIESHSQQMPETTPMPIVTSPQKRIRAVDLISDPSPSEPAPPLKRPRAVRFE